MANNGDIAVRHDYVRTRARMYFTEMNIMAPPINVRNLLLHYANIVWFSDIGDGATHYRPPSNGNRKYTIFLNKKVITGRLSWTYAHELAHIVLGHFFDYQIDRLSKKELELLDREANLFADLLLMPENWVLSHCQTPITKRSISRLIRLFNVSWQAMERRLVELRLCSKAYIDQLFDICPVNTTDNYCTGEMWNGQWFVSPVLDADPNASVACPCCGNTRFSDDGLYCRHCGLFYRVGDEPEHPCDYPRLNPPDALNCEYCGALTVLGLTLQRRASHKKA